MFKTRRRLADLIVLLLAIAALSAACGGGSGPAFPATVEPEPFFSRASEAVTSGPTATPLPLPSPTATPPTPTPVSIFDLEIDLGVDADPLAKEAFERVQTLTADFSPRASATDEELAAADYLAGEFEAMGYGVSIQTFSVEVLVTDLPILSVDSPGFADLEAIPLTRSGTGRVTGTLVFVGKAFEADVPSEGLTGKVALIERGNITFSEKVARVHEAGAVAVVVFNDRLEAFRGRLLEVSAIPAVAISGQRGRALRDFIATSPIAATVSVIFETRESRNVIAEKPGVADDGKVVVLGGHFDTVPDVPGANDNGSGIATLLTIAGEVAERPYPFTLKFISFGSEELGLRGSRHYVSTLAPEDRSNVLAMFNFDALATGAATTVVGTDDLLDRVVGLAGAKRILVERQRALESGTSSDHAAFEDVGIPVVAFVAEDFSRIHTTRDTLEFVRPKLLGNSAMLAVALLDDLARQ